jgi:hypothetical protein
MNATCAVMQKSLEPPTTEQLRNAFRDVPGLTAIDADILGKHAFGLLVKGFEPERAAALQSALATQGVETEVVVEADLPQLPEMRNLHQLECTPDALLIYDPLNRSFPLKWENIMLVAAGKVMLDEINQVRRVTQPQQFGGYGSGRGATTEPQVSYSTSYERNERWLLEITITGAALRYGVNADQVGPLLFHGLGDRAGDDLQANFTLLVQDILKSAPQAAINRGAYYLRENSDKVFAYPSKNAFYEEIIWLLWQMARNQTQ